VISKLILASHFPLSYPAKAYQNKTHSVKSLQINYISFFNEKVFLKYLNSNRQSNSISIPLNADSALGIVTNLMRNLG
jgi:hypothetical protein